MVKKGNEWTYVVQVPLTNLPTFTIYKVSPFPVFPEPNNGSALVVDIPTDAQVILAADDKYFIDKIDRERCTYSGTHGVCSGPIGLIDIDHSECLGSLLLHSPTLLMERCKFSKYEGLFPRIAISMEQFLISSTRSHDFVKSCAGKTIDHITTKPGSTRFPLAPGCSLNTSDILLLNPGGNSSITNQKLDYSPKSFFRFRERLRLDESNYIAREIDPPNLLTRLAKIETEIVEDESEFNEHLENNSVIYVPLLLLILLSTIVVVSLIYLKYLKTVPIIISMRKFLLPETRAALKNTKMIRQQPSTE